MNKGMSSALIAIIFSVFAIIILLLSSFGPGELTKLAKKQFFENKNIVPEKYDNEIIEGEGLLPVKISGSNEEITRQVVRELAVCWKEMKKGKQNLKCTNLCFCRQTPCSCRTLTKAELQTKDPLIPLGKIREYLKAQELSELPAKDLEGAPEALIDNWKEEPHFARTNILTSGSEDEMLKYTGIFDNINYLVCADYDRGDATGDDLFVTDDLNFNCE